MDGAAERADLAPSPGVARPLAVWAAITALLAAVNAFELTWGWWIAPAAWGAIPVTVWLWRGPDPSWGAIPVTVWLWRGPDPSWGVAAPSPLGRSLAELAAAGAGCAAVAAWVAQWAPLGTFSGGWIVVACCWVPLLEELFFRGWLQGALRARWGATGAVIGAAVLFGLSHAVVQPPLAGLATIAPALLFGLVRERQGSLVGAIVLHGVANLSLLWFSHAPPL